MYGMAEVWRGIALHGESKAAEQAADTEAVLHAAEAKGRKGSSEVERGENAGHRRVDTMRKTGIQRFIITAQHMPAYVESAATRTPGTSVSTLARTLPKAVPTCVKTVPTTGVPSTSVSTLFTSVATVCWAGGGVA